MALSDAGHGFLDVRTRVTNGRVALAFASRFTDCDVEVLHGRQAD